MNTNITAATDLVTMKNGQPVTTSLKIAEVFGKRHDHVMNAIKSLDIPEEWSVPNFRETQYKHPQNKQTYPMYFVTRDGFTLLAMGFTGAKAMEFKLAYIEAFNAMEKQVKDADKTLSAVMDFVGERAKEQIQADIDYLRSLLGSWLSRHGYTEQDPFEVCVDLAAGRTDRLYQQQVKQQLIKMTDHRLEA